VLSEPPHDQPVRDRADRSRSRFSQHPRPRAHASGRPSARARTRVIKRAMSPRTIRVYSDYKSPYAYLAKDPAYDLERATGVTLEWLPYTLDIPPYPRTPTLPPAPPPVEHSP